MVRTRLTSSRRQPLGLLDVPDLGRQIVATERDAEQEPHPGHDPIAVADAPPAPAPVQLKPAHLVGRCRIGRAFEPGGEPLAALDMTTLRVWVELERSNVLDHALTQRTDSGSVAHGNSILSEVDNPSISVRLSQTRQCCPLSQLPASRLLPPAQRAGAQRLCALAPLRHADCIERRPLSGVTRKTFAHAEFFSV